MFNYLYWTTTGTLTGYILMRFVFLCSVRASMIGAIVGGMCGFIQEHTNKSILELLVIGYYMI